MPPPLPGLDPYDHHRPLDEWDPPLVHAELRRTCPIYRTPSHGGYWLVTTHDLIQRCGRDPATFSSEHDLDGSGPGREFAGIAIPPQGRYRSIPSEIDGSAFQQYRKLLLPWFSPAAVERWGPTVRTYAQDCLKRHLTSGKIDLVLDLANPVPAMLTLALVGLDVDDWKRFAQPLHTLVHVEPESEPWHGALEQITELRRTLAETVEDRRRRPRSDLATSVAQGTVGGRPVDPADAVNVLFAVVAGGVDTTTALLANTLAWLDEDLEARQRLIAQPSRRQHAREEFLRVFSPAPATARTTAGPVVLGDQPLDRGERVLLSWAAANRDAAVFAEPETVHLDRDASAHVAFGYGPHRCIGAPLARLTFDAVLDAVLETIGDYRIDRQAAARYPRVGAVNGWISLPARFSPHLRG